MNNVIVICNVPHDIVPGVCILCERDRLLAQLTEARDKALEEIETLMSAVEGRHFSAIETAATERDKIRHGIKAALAMELRVAIHALKSRE